MKLFIVDMSNIFFKSNSEGFFTLFYNSSDYLEFSFLYFLLYHIIYAYYKWMFFPFKLLFEIIIYAELYDPFKWSILVNFYVLQYSVLCKLKCSNKIDSHIIYKTII